MFPNIKGFIQNSLIDWPGRIASIVFLPGCNFRCPFCHAAHLVVRPNELESIPFDSIRASLVERADWIDGVIISGGEPTTSEGLPALVEAIGALGFPVKLDTNGSHPEIVESLVAGGVVQAISMDVKAPLDERYKRLAGVEVDLEAIRRSIGFLLSGGVAEYEFRTTVPPGFLDGDAIVEIARTIEGAKAYVLQDFQGVDCIDASLAGLKPLGPEVLRGYAERARAYVQRCWVRGSEEPPGGSGSDLHRA
ncbi:MAG TPA: anaerobic ribonucleoside-triphosphate reductase activating protein [Planctomycetota bacterium]|nr:anaerobic ribonucleoside-triphosphate reductase activating protein [Planctomycetota bacterium]